MIWGSALSMHWSSTSAIWMGKNQARSMLEVVLTKSGSNQTLAAEILGINRNTLRKKLTEHQLL